MLKKLPLEKRDCPVSLEKLPKGDSKPKLRGINKPGDVLPPAPDFIICPFLLPQCPFLTVILTVSLISSKALSDFFFF